MVSSELVAQPWSGSNQTDPTSRTGNVGIGTTSPFGKIDIRGNGLQRIVLRSNNDQASMHFWSSSHKGYFVGTGTAQDFFIYNDQTVYTPFRILNNGNIGIGAATPGSLLSVNGSASVGSSFSSTSAPPNGLIVAGQTGIGTSTVSGGTSLEVGGGAFAHLFSGSVGVSQATWSRINLSNTVNINPSNFAAGAATFQNATSGSIYGLTSNREGGYIQNGVLNENGNVSPLVVYKSPLRPLVFASEGANGALQETMSLSASGQMVLTGVSPTGFGSKLEVYGGNITQVSSGQPAGQTPSDIFTSIGGRLGNQPPPQAPGINAQGLRVQWGQNGANFGMTDFDDPGQPTIKNALISWQDLTATNLGQVKNRLLIGFRDATSAAGGLPNFREVATFIADGKGILGVGTKTPGSFISSGNNMSVGTNFSINAAPLNSLIVEGRVGIGFFNPVSTFQSGPPADIPVAGTIVNGTTPVSLDVLNGVRANVYGRRSDARLKSNVRDIKGSLDVIKSLRGVKYVQSNLKETEEEKVSFHSIGFIAQEFKEVLPELALLADDGYYALDYDGVIPILVEAIKEQQKAIEQLQEQNSQLKTEGNNLRISDQLEYSKPLTRNKLEQNIPNPFSGSTTIRYSFVEGNRASLMVFDLNGTTVHKVENLDTGDHEIVLELSRLASGMYYYSLVVDGAESVTKRMVINK